MTSQGHADVSMMSDIINSTVMHSNNHENSKFEFKISNFENTNIGPNNILESNTLIGPIDLMGHHFSHTSLVKLNHQENENEKTQVSKANLEGEPILGPISSVSNASQPRPI